MKYSVNLASRSYINKKALYLGYFLCGFVLLAGLVYNLGYYFELRAQINTTEARLHELEETILASQGGDVAGYTAARYEKVLVEIEQANSILSRDSFRWTALLGKLEEVVPGNVKILSIAPDHKKKTITLAGMSRRLKDMKRFIDNLIASNHYTDVLLMYQEDTESGDIKFTIKLLGAF